MNTCYFSQNDPIYRFSAGRKDLEHRVVTLQGPNQCIMSQQFVKMAAPIIGIF